MSTKAELQAKLAELPAKLGGISDVFIKSFESVLGDVMQIVEGTAELTTQEAIAVWLEQLPGQPIMWRAIATEIRAGSWRKP